jgi:DNA repair exonuclease SbcCD ATPase subunit
VGAALAGTGTEEQHQQNAQKRLARSKTTLDAANKALATKQQEQGAAAAAAAVAQSALAAKEDSKGQVQQLLVDAEGRLAHLQSDLQAVECQAADVSGTKSRVMDELLSVEKELHMAEQQKQEATEHHRAANALDHAVSHLLSDSSKGVFCRCLPDFRLCRRRNMQRTLSSSCCRCTSRVMCSAVCCNHASSKRRTPSAPNRQVLVQAACRA